MTNTYTATGFQMIREIKIENFRCFEYLTIENCARLNVIVGDNGSGKTALLESIFLPLCGGAEVLARLRQQRGMDGALGGTRDRIEAGLWGDFFHNFDFYAPVSLRLVGDGEEARSLVMTKTYPQITLPLDGVSGSEMVQGPVLLTWTDGRGRPRAVQPQVTAQGLVFPDTGEDLPNFHHYAANQTVGSSEVAFLFSEISKFGDDIAFISEFSAIYENVKNVSIQIHAGAPVLFVTLANRPQKIPLPNVSGAINKVMALLLVMASRRRSVITVDEIENGIHHSRMEDVWRAILLFMRKFDSQLFVTTHSLECLSALARAAGRGLEDISLWRMERDNLGSPQVVQFSGNEFAAGMEYNEEVR